MNIRGMAEKLSLRHDGIIVWKKEEIPDNEKPWQKKKNECRFSQEVSGFEISEVWSLPAAYLPEV